jgi:flavin reductase (DIM6/NTAB) family NADH-FMN oxidoreductase RutF
VVPDRKVTVYNINGAAIDVIWSRRRADETEIERVVIYFELISFFTVVGRFPPVLSISLQPRSDGLTLKDTFVNIRDTGEFVVNLASIGQADAVHRSAYEFDSDVDEFQTLCWERALSEVISAPRIAGAPISFECVVDRIIAMPPLDDHVVWGRVTRIRVRDDLYLPNGRIDVGALGVFGRLAGEYTVVARPVWLHLGIGILAWV